MTHPPFLPELIPVARGLEPADLAIRNARLINVLSGEIHDCDVRVARGRIVSLDPGPAREEVDADGRYLCPGLVEGHIHVESTLLTPNAFAAVAARHGTAAVVCDPHEIANVLGAEGVRWILETTRGLPLTFHVMMPSCVPATHLENAGARLTPRDVADFLEQYTDRMPGLAEMMNYPGVLFQDDDVLAKIGAAWGTVVDGHAPLLTGADLSAYIGAGPGSDHECSTPQEARDKLRKGMHLMLRQGSHEHNMLDLLPEVTDFNAHNCSLVSDDRHPDDLLHKGHLDHSVRLAIGAGVPPVRAVQMASINTARYFRLHGRGAVAPGYRADFFLVDDLGAFRPGRCWLGGSDVRSLDFSTDVPLPGNTMHLRAPATEATFAMPHPGGRARVIGTVPGQIVTETLLLDVPQEGGEATASPEADIAKAAVLERHGATGNVGLGFVCGLGLRAGAVASSVAHDSHNLIVAGMDDASMARAANAVAEQGGGFAVARGETVLAKLPLPVAGLMSGAAAEDVAAQLDALNTAARTLMDGEGGDPFMLLSFLALPVIPHLKLTDQGLVDVDAFAHVPPFV